MKKKEEWRKIENYMYEVSSKGRVRSIRNNMVMKQSKHYKGHMFLYLYNDSSRKKFFVHRLVAEAFIPNPEKKDVVNHIDEKKQNNRVENLEWMSGAENTRLYHRNKMMRQEWVKAQCANGHLFGNGAEVCFKDQCPECDGEIVAFVQRRIMTISVAKAKGFIWSRGSAS